MRIFWPFMCRTLSKERSARRLGAFQLSCLLNNLGDDTGADRTTALTDGEAQLLLHGNRGDQLHFNRHIVARHHHLSASRQCHHTRHVGGAEVELRAAVGEERGWPATL